MRPGTRRRRQDRESTPPEFRVSCLGVQLVDFVQNLAQQVSLWHSQNARQWRGKYTGEPRGAGLDQIGSGRSH